MKARENYKILEFFLHLQVRDLKILWIYLIKNWPAIFIILTSFEKFRIKSVMAKTKTVSSKASKEKRDQESSDSGGKPHFPSSDILN